MNIKKNIIDFFENIWWSIQDFFKDWIYPAYYLRNLLFYRYDRVKIKELKPWEYSDVMYRMERSVYTLIHDFLINEKPEECVVWYEGSTPENSGHKYGEMKDIETKEKIPVLFPEYDGMWIMDLIKKVENWDQKGRKEFQNNVNKLYDYHRKLSGPVKFIPAEESTIKGAEKMIHEIDKAEIKSFDDIYKDSNLVEFLRKFVSEDEKLWLNEDFIFTKAMKLESELELIEQKMLHLAIEVRPYLWT